MFIHTQFAWYSVCCLIPILANKYIIILSLHIYYNFQGKFSSFIPHSLTLWHSFKGVGINKLEILKLKLIFGTFSKK